MGDYRTNQQAGWVTRAFGPVKAVVLPEPAGVEQRVMEVSYPNRGGKEGDLFLTSLLSLTGCEWVNIATVGAAGDEATEGGVYRLLVGKAAISAWVDLPLWVMAGRIAYWRPAAAQPGGRIDHGIAEGGEGLTLAAHAADVAVDAEGVANVAVTVQAAAGSVKGQREIVFEVRALDGDLQRTQKSRFFGPF